MGFEVWFSSFRWARDPKPRSSSTAASTPVLTICRSALRRRMIAPSARRPCSILGRDWLQNWTRRSPWTAPSSIMPAKCRWTIDGCITKHSRPCSRQALRCPSVSRRKSGARKCCRSWSSSAFSPELFTSGCTASSAKTLSLNRRLCQAPVHFRSRLARSPLDAWALIDVCHHIRQLIFQISGLRHKTAALQIFVRATEQIDVLRHHVQHLASGIQSIP